MPLSIRYSPNQCCRALAYLPTGDALVCGRNDGSVVVLDTTFASVDGTLPTKFELRDRQQWIQVLKFDPSGGFLAVGSHDNFIDIYDTVGLMERAEPPALLATCRGHSSFIKHLDWSQDGAYLRSNCGAYELLFWDRCGRALKKKIRR